MKINCPTCNKEFNIPPYRLVRSKKCYCSNRCATTALRGITRSEEFKKKVSLATKGINTWTAGSKQPLRAGEKSHFWRGGVSKINRTERQNYCATTAYKVFRREVLKRDNYTCQICKARTCVGNKVILQVDHIKPFLLYPELRMDFNNVRTVCKQCHWKTDTYGARVHKNK